MPLKAQIRGGSIAPTYSQRGTMTLYARQKVPVRNVRYAGWASGSVWSSRKISPPLGVHPRNVQPVAIPTKHPGPKNMNFSKFFCGIHCWYNMYSVIDDLIRWWLQCKTITVSEAVLSFLLHLCMSSKHAEKKNISTKNIQLLDIYRVSLSLEAPNHCLCIQSNSAGFSFVNTDKQVHLKHARRHFERNLVKDVHHRSVPPRNWFKKLETRGSWSNACRLLSLGPNEEQSVQKYTTHNRTTQIRYTPRDSSRQLRHSGKSIPEFEERHSSVLGRERRPVSA